MIDNASDSGSNSDESLSDVSHAELKRLHDESRRDINAVGIITADAISDASDRDSARGVTTRKPALSTRYRASSKEWLLMCTMDWRYVTIYATPCVSGQPLTSEAEFPLDWSPQIACVAAQLADTFSISSVHPMMAMLHYLKEYSPRPFSFRLQDLLCEQVVGKECWQMRAPSESAAASAFCALHNALHEHAEFFSSPPGDAHGPSYASDDAHWDLTRRASAFVSNNDALSVLRATLYVIAERAVEVFSCPLEDELRARGLCKQDAVGWCEGEWPASE